MSNRNTIAPDSLTTPEETYKELSKQLTRIVQDKCGEMSRNLTSALQYQAEPVEVVRADELKSCTVAMQGVSRALDASISRLTTIAEDIKPRTVIQAEPAPEPEVKWHKRLWENFKHWWSSDNGYLLRFAAYALLLCSVLFYGVYLDEWSDDAWARRAYNTAVIAGDSDPGSVYHEVRKLFRSDRRRTAKGKVRDYEESVAKFLREQRDEEKREKEAGK